MQCRWRRPTLIGDTMHMVLVIAGKAASSKSGRGTGIMKRTAVNHRDEVVMESEWKLAIKRQRLAAEAGPD